MLRLIILNMALIALVSCNNTKSENQSPAGTDTSTTKPQTETVTLPELPPFVVFKNWQPGNPQNTQLVLNVYNAWDSKEINDMALYFADSTEYDLPAGSYTLLTKETVETKLRQWRNGFKETSNIPFSLLPVYNKDRDQQWVIAWVWSKWRYTDGKKDSMLYCDNWLIKDGKIAYLNSLENRTSKKLSTRLNQNIPK